MTTNLASVACLRANLAARSQSAEQASVGPDRTAIRGAEATSCLPNPTWKFWLDSEWDDAIDTFDGTRFERPLDEF